MKILGSSKKHTMFITVGAAAVLILLVGLVSSPAFAVERDPLLQVLMRKGIITEKEAVEIEREVKELEEKKRQEVDREAREKKGADLPKGLKGLSVGMLGFVDYSSGKEARPGEKEESFNRFKLTRGYLTVKKKLTPWLGARMTTDIRQDEAEDWKVRLKYLYAEIRPGNLGFLTDLKSEIGLGHIPWLDFEEHVNPYRSQGTMAVERAGVFNSADLGLSLRGNFAGRLADAASRTGNHHYDGRYGSWHLGIYNGSGYHAKEKNNNKVIEGRVTLRPLPDKIPGLQFSYFGIFGEGNREHGGEFPDYDVNMGMISYEHPHLILTAQYFATEGNAKGSWVDGDGDALTTGGYSFFANYRLPVFERKLSIFARYDHFDADRDDEIADKTAYDMMFGGLAYELYHGNLILLTYETTDYEDDFGGKKGAVPSGGTNLGDEDKIQAVYQIKF